MQEQKPIKITMRESDFECTWTFVSTWAEDQAFSKVVKPAFALYCAEGGERVDFGPSAEGLLLWHLVREMGKAHLEIDRRTDLLHAGEEWQRFLDDVYCNFHELKLQWVLLKRLEARAGATAGSL